jgi:hypothetical protein
MGEEGGVPNDWYFLDPVGVPQGPFSLPLMRLWKECGHISMDAKVYTGSSGVIPQGHPLPLRLAPYVSGGDDGVPPAWESMWSILYVEGGDVYGPYPQGVIAGWLRDSRLPNTVWLRLANGEEQQADAAECLRFKEASRGEGAMTQEGGTFVALPALIARNFFETQQ